MVSVRNCRNIFVPTGAARSAFVVLIGCGAYLSEVGGGFTLGEYHAAMGETAWRWLADHMGRGTENQVLGNIPVLAHVLVDQAIFAGRNPMPHVWRGFRHEGDIPKVAHGLNVAAIVPSEYLHGSLGENGNHGSGPAGVLEALVAVLKGSLDHREHVAALEGIAALAY